MEVLATVAAFVLQHALKVLGIGRMRPTRIVFVSHFGTQYSCNPKYLSEHLEAHAPTFELVWAFEHPERYAYLRDRGIQLVRYNSPAFVRACLTSHFLVTNCEMPAWLPTLKRQVVMNTWHGGGAYKRVGADFHKGSRWRDLRSAMGRRKPTVYLSSSEAFTQLTVRGSMQHEGEVIPCGMPRNDILVRRDRPEASSRVRTQLGISSEDRILLYAPTYREGREASTYLFDAARVRAALARRFGGTWTVLVRMHYFVMRQLPPSDGYVDASSYGDMQELLYAADMLVTDYSSSIWDFGLTGRPCALYATDLDAYDLERGFYSDIRTWPWPLAKNNDELEQTILSFDEDAYARRLQRHYRDLGSHETGSACQTVAAYLAEHLR